MKPHAPCGDPVPLGDPLPLSDLARVHDLQQHLAAALVLLARGGRIHDRHPRLAAAANRRARRLLKHLSELLAAMQEANAHPVDAPAAGDRQ